MGGAFSIAQGGRGPLLLALGRVCASWAGLVLFAGVIAVNQSRSMRLYGESAALRLQVC